MASGPASMTMDRLVGVEVYLRLDQNTDFVEAEEEDGRIRVKVTGVDPTLGIWVLANRYSVRQQSHLTTVPAHVLIPFRSILSIAMIDKALQQEAEATSLEEAMAGESASKEDMERNARDKVNCSRQSYRSAKFEGANLAGIVMRETDLERANLRRADLSNADLKDATLREVNAEGANFQGAYLWEAILEGSMLTGANFKGANLYLANLKSASLANAVLDGANLVECTLTDAKITGASLDNVKLLRAKIGKMQGTDREWKLLGTALKKEGKEYFTGSYLSEARWCLEQASNFFKQAKDQVSMGEVKNILDDVEEEERLSMAMSKERERG